MTRAEDIATGVSLGVDYLGIIFYEKSKRFAPPAACVEIARELDRYPLPPKVVGVFVNPSTSMIVEAKIAVPSIEIIQLHGCESPEEVRGIQSAFPNLEIWKAIPISAATDINLGYHFNDSSKLILLDSKRSAPSGNSVDFGGTGQAFDWEILKSDPPHYRFGLAGGINRHNISQAMKFRPWLIDVSSGIESSPGVKDSSLMRDLAATIQNYDG